MSRSIKIKDKIDLTLQVRKIGYGDIYICEFYGKIFYFFSNQSIIRYKLRLNMRIAPLFGSHDMGTADAMSTYGF